MEEHLSLGQRLQIIILPKLLMDQTQSLRECLLSDAFELQQLFTSMLYTSLEFASHMERHASASDLHSQKSTRSKKSGGGNETGRNVWKSFFLSCLSNPNNVEIIERIERKFNEGLVQFMKALEEKVIYATALLSSPATNEQLTKRLLLLVLLLCEPFRYG